MKVKMTQILLIEDDPAIAQTLLFALKKEGWQVAWADTLTKGFELVSQADELSALILDVGLPDGTGFEFCEWVRAGNKHPFVPILFLTARTDEAERLLGLELGADDYIAKPFSPKEVVARIKAIFRRQALLISQFSEQNQDNLHAAQEPHSPQHDFTKTLGKHTWHYFADAYRLSLNGVALTLSKTELALMLAFLHSPSRVFSREQLLSHATDHPEHRLARTVDAHIKTLRQKLGEVCDDEIIVTHRGIGYGLCGE